MACETPITAAGASIYTQNLGTGIEGRNRVLSCALSPTGRPLQNGLFSGVNETLYAVALQTFGNNDQQSRSTLGFGDYAMHIPSPSSAGTLSRPAKDSGCCVANLTWGFQAVNFVWTESTFSCDPNQRGGPGSCDCNRTLFAAAFASKDNPHPTYATTTDLRTHKYIANFGCNVPKAITAAPVYATHGYRCGPMCGNAVIGTGEYSSRVSCFFVGGRCQYQSAAGNVPCPLPSCSVSPGHELQKCKTCVAGKYRTGKCGGFWSHDPTECHACRMGHVLDTLCQVRARNRSFAHK